MISVLTLTIVYAALSTTLNINGTAEISSASWDIHLENVQLNNNSVTSDVPTITDKTTATFSTTLSKPGDFYEFTIDVVNNGGIDAVIDSVTKTPELTDNQKKYLNYIVEYQNGEAITTTQLLEKKSFVRLKVKLEFRKDITAVDLPKQAETLNLSFEVNYVQSEDTGTTTPDNEEESFRPSIISGDLETVGSEVAIGDEHFYIISSDEDSVTMLAKYNLHVGNSVDSSWRPTLLENPTGIQDSSAIGSFDDNPVIGVLKFSSSKYWGNASSGTYVYDSRSTLYNYVENYKVYLESYGAAVEEARLIKVEELVALGCNSSSYSCKSAPSWVYSTSYWTGNFFNENFVNSIFGGGSYIASSEYGYDIGHGIRPVITLTL